MKIIDPHLHLFTLSQGQYQWLKPDNPPYWQDKSLIHRDFSEGDIQLTDGLSLSALIHIEAGFNNQHPEKELAWLTSSVNKPFKAIASVDLLLPPEKFHHSIKVLQEQPSLIGVRHILDEQASSILNSRHCSENLYYIAKQGLIFECQLSLTDTPAITRLHSLLKQNPALVCIINHAGFPPHYNAENWTIWQDTLKQLAKHANLAIKCSGWEMSHRDYEQAQVKAVINESINLLGIEKVMVASNFPLTLFNCSYQEYWYKMIQLLSQSLPNTSISKLCYENAMTWYNLKL